MGFVDIKITGDKALLKKLRKMGSRRITNRVMKKATTAAARVVVKEAKSRAPKETGTLKKSITFKILGKGFRTTAIVGANADAVGPDGRQPVHYDFLVEYGYTIGETGVPARSFLRAGFESAAPVATQIYQQKLKEAIEKEAAKQ